MSCFVVVLLAAGCGGGLDSCPSTFAAPADFPVHQDRVVGYGANRYAVTWVQYQSRGTLAISHDGGAQWSATSVGYQPHAVYATSALLIVAGVRFIEESDPVMNAVVEVSPDDGVSFVETELDGRAFGCAVLDVRVEGARLVALGDCPDARAWISDDAGATWREDAAYAGTPRCSS